jgi:2-methylcitrate dehydratase
MKKEPIVTVDPVIAKIADYAVARKRFSASAYRVAHYCLLDSLACALDALEHPECTKLLGPLAASASVRGGARVPGTKFVLDPYKAAFDIGTAIRWLDFNDAWFAAEGGHPSDNLGAVIATADWMSRGGRAARGRTVRVRDVLDGLIKAYEIQGVLALENSLVKVGIDSMVFTSVASAAAAANLMGGSRDQVVNAVSNALMDGGCLRLYRKGKYTGWRKSWAAGDATSRGVLHALMALRGEMGYPQVLSAPQWGFCDVVMQGKPIVLPRKLGSHIVEHILFKLPFPSLFHAQTASECALRLHPLVRDRITEIKAVRMRTHERGLHAANRPGPLANPADRDHSMQYIIAVILLKGHLDSHDYSDKAARDPRIDALRANMTLTEDQDYTRDFYDPAKRSNVNSMQIEFTDGTLTPEIRVDYPLGHPTRRREGVVGVERKLRRSVERTYSPRRAAAILAACRDPARLINQPFSKFMDLWVGA